MRLLVPIVVVALTACVGPSPDPPPAWALRIVDAETVAFGTTIAEERLEERLGAACAELGWRLDSGSSRLAAGDLRMRCTRRPEEVGVVLQLAAESRGDARALERAARALAERLAAIESRR